MTQWKTNPNATVPIPCPKCGHKQNELVSRLRQNPQITCGGCGVTIAINGEQLDMLMKAFEGFKR